MQRVLRRAGEFASAAPRADTDQSAITEAALLAAAEVGLDRDDVARALAWERLGADEPARLGDRFVGPATVHATTEMSVTVDEALTTLDGWLVDGHHMRRERRDADHASWSRRDDMVAGGARMVRKWSGEGDLGEVRRISATARPTLGRTVVRLSADRRLERALFGWSGGVVAAAAEAGVIVGSVEVSPYLMALTPVAVGAGLAVASAGRVRAGKVGEALQRLLDAVEHGHSPTRLRDRLFSWARPFSRRHRRR